jgi:thymidylate synthase
MNNNLDKQYFDLLKDILENGVKKSDRTGTGTISVFGRTIRHKMSDGFPILTSKKVYWKGVVGELIWFLRGDTNIQYLVQNDVNIWVGDTYKVYCKSFTTPSNPKSEIFLDQLDSVQSIPLTEKEFINQIKYSSSFAKEHGELGPVYGAQWRAWKTHIDPHTGDNLPKGVEFEIDQIKILLKKLKENPDDRRMIVSAWNPAVVDTVVLPPCHYSFQCYTKELSMNDRIEIFRSTYPDKTFDDFKPGGMEVQSLNHQLKTRLDNANIPKRSISLLVNIRSQDTVLGQPFNIASYGLLLCMLGKEVNMIPDELIVNTGDTHIYLNQIEAVQEQLIQETFELPKLNDLWLNPNKNIFDYEIEDIILNNYKSSKSIKAPLSN